MDKEHDYSRRKSVLGQRRIDRWKFVAFVVIGCAIAAFAVVAAVLK